MKTKKKVFWNGIFVLSVFVLTIYGVFHGEDLEAMGEAIRKVDARWMIPGVFLVVFFIGGESIILWYMLFQLHYSFRHRRPAHADIFYEEGKDTHSCCHGDIDGGDDHI